MLCGLLDLFAICQNDVTYIRILAQGLMPFAPLSPILERNVFKFRVTSFTQKETQVTSSQDSSPLTLI